MAWETILLKVPEPKKHKRLHKHDGLCPKCDGNLFTIPYQTNKPYVVTSRNTLRDEMEFLVLICDRCGQFMAFEGCTGDCASFQRVRCETCGKFYCTHCGISADINVDEKLIELRYCNDHIPGWYRNR